MRLIKMQRNVSYLKLKLKYNLSQLQEQQQKQQKQQEHLIQHGVNLPITIKGAAANNNTNNVLN